MDIPLNARDRAGPGATAAPQGTTLVWDLPVRLFHWLMVASFALAWLTADSERWRLEHVTLGYTMAALVAFRLVWGVVGTRHARFAAFVRGPRAVAGYLRSLLAGRPEHHVGHNPAGAVAIVLLLVLTLGVAASGWLSYQEIGGEWLEEVHEVAAHAMLVIVGVHLAGVLLGSLAHRENLVGAMITGRKRVPRNEGIDRARLGVAALLAAGVFGLWAWQWHDAPAAGGTAASADAHEDGPSSKRGARSSSRPHDDD